MERFSPFLSHVHRERFKQLIIGHHGLITRFFAGETILMNCQLAIPEKELHISTKYGSLKLGTSIAYGLPYGNSNSSWI